MAKDVGVCIAFEDLLIGTPALHLGYAVVTLNVRHFRLIAGPSVIQLWKFDRKQNLPPLRCRRVFLPPI
jgi:hypothetical protein